MVTVSAYDNSIDGLISETVPAIEHAIQPERIADTANAGLQATLNLGALEIVCGEFLAQLSRSPGWLDEIAVGDLRFAPAAKVDPLDPFGLKTQGWARLRPYLRVDPALPAPAAVRLAGGKQGPAL
jgi:hypothetical protein